MPQLVLKSAFRSTVSSGAGVGGHVLQSSGSEF